MTHANLQGNLPAIAESGNERFAQVKGVYERHDVICEVLITHRVRPGYSTGHGPAGPA